MEQQQINNRERLITENKREEFKYWERDAGADWLTGCRCEKRERT